MSDQLNRYLVKFENWDFLIRNNNNCCVNKDQLETLSLFVNLKGYKGYFIQNKNNKDWVTFVLRQD